MSVALTVGERSIRVLPDGVWAAAGTAVVQKSAASASGDRRMVTEGRRGEASGSVAGGELAPPKLTRRRGGR